MSQPSGDGQPSGGYEDPPPLETVDPSHVSMPPPHLAENMPLRRAAEADVSARFVTFNSTSTFQVVCHFCTRNF